MCLFQVQHLHPLLPVRLLLLCCLPLQVLLVLSLSVVLAEPQPVALAQPNLLAVQVSPASLRTVAVVAVLAVHSVLA
jgi:hypothetical protein